MRTAHARPSTLRCGRGVCSRPHAFTERDLDVLRTYCALAAALLSNARLYNESERERRQSDALAEIARAVGESLRMGEVLRLILRHSMSLLGVEGRTSPSRATSTCTSFPR